MVRETLGALQVQATDEQKKELHSIEAEIRRRIPIGSTISERRLTEDLERWGMSAMLVKRALCIMHSTNELKSLARGKFIRRMA